MRAFLVSPPDADAAGRGKGIRGEGFATRITAEACLSPEGNWARGAADGPAAKSIFRLIATNVQRAASSLSRMDDDRTVVARQIGREPRAFRRVVVRCPFGRPAVTEQSPYDQEGEPFPTTYYVTCRHLVAQISRLEAAGGVDRWSDAVARERSLRVSRERADEEQRRIRTQLAAGATGTDGGTSLELGVGGQRRGAGSLKCLHAHVGFALANPGYELGERIAQEIDPLWPDSCCSE